MMDDMGWGIGMMVVMPLISVLVLVGVVGGVVFLVRSLPDRGRTDQNRVSKSRP